MIVLILGLLIFLGTHSVRIFADGWRTRQIARLGALPWKGLHAAASAVGLTLVVIGYGLARSEPVLLWTPPTWTRHVAALLMIPAFVLIAAAYVPGTRLRAAVGHPMLAGVKLWAFAHLIANGTLADALLFGSFLAWAVADFIVSRRRDRRAGTVRGAGTLHRDVIAVAIGLAVWFALAFQVHAILFGIRPFG